MRRTNSKAGDKRHPIQVVSRRLGLSIDVLRVWEKRYGLVTPARSEGGHRLYSDADIERLRLVREAMAGGRRVGQLAALTEEQLSALIEEDRSEAVAQAAVGIEKQTLAQPDALVADCLQAVSALDANMLKAAIDRAFISLSPVEFIERVATQFMHLVGDLWHRRQLSPAHEHLASSVTRNALAEVIARLQPDDGAHRLVVATPSGQRHEIAAALVTTTAQLEGWAVTYLGPDLPAADIASAVEQTNANAVALSITVAPSDPQLTDELNLLRQSLPPEVTMLVGGQAADSMEAELKAIGARYTHDLANARQALRELAGTNKSTDGPG